MEKEKEYSMGGLNKAKANMNVDKMVKKHKFKEQKFKRQAKNE